MLRRVLWLTTSALALAAMLAPGAGASPADLTIEGEDMALSPAGIGANAGDANASGGLGKHIWANGKATKTVTTTRSTVHMFVRIKPHWCTEAPRIAVRAGGRQWFSGPVNGPATGETLQYVGFRISLPAGTHTVEVELTNAYQQWAGPVKVCGRAIFLDQVTLVTTPFTPNGWRNKPLAADTPIASNSSVLRDEIVDQFWDNYNKPVPPDTPPQPGAWIEAHNWSTPVYIVPPGQPTVPVKHVVPAGEQPNATLEEHWRNVPLPPDTRPSPGTNGNTDGIALVWQPSTDTLWEFWLLAKDGQGNWGARYGGRMTGVSQNDGAFPHTGPGRGGFGASGTAISLLSGLQRMEEVRRGIDLIRNGNLAAAATAIDHVVDFGISTPRGARGWCWPAQRTDPPTDSSTSTAPEAVPAGTRFRLPANFDVAAWEDPNPAVQGKERPLTPHARLIVETVKRHGMIAKDQGSHLGFWAEDPWPTGTDPYGELWDFKYPSGRPNGVLEHFPWTELQALAPEGEGCEWEYPR